MEYESIMVAVLVLAAIGYLLVLPILIEIRAIIGNRVPGLGPLLVDTLLACMVWIGFLFDIAAYNEIAHAPKWSPFMVWALLVGFILIPWTAIVRFYRWRWKVGPHNGK